MMNGGLPAIALLGQSGGSSGGGGGSDTALYLECDVTFGENVVEGNAIYLDLSGGANSGKAFKADCTNTAKYDAIAIVKANASANTVGRVYLGGRVNALIDSVTSTTDNGKPVYVSSTGGALTITQPSASGSTIKKIGYLVGGNGTDTLVNIIISLGNPVRLS